MVVQTVLRVTLYRTADIQEVTQYNLCFYHHGTSGCRSEVYNSLSEVVYSGEKLSLKTMSSLQHLLLRQLRLILTKLTSLDAAEGSTTRQLLRSLLVPATKTKPSDSTRRNKRYKYNTDVLDSGHRTVRTISAQEVRQLQERSGQSISTCLVAAVTGLQHKEPRHLVQQASI